MRLPRCGEIFKGQRDFKIRSEPFQPRYKHESDPDIPLGHEYEVEKKVATEDPYRGKHKDGKVAQADARAEKDEKQGKKM
jgi:hypothetical protein